MIIVDCPSCQSGRHEGHVEHWGLRPEGVIDGEFCYCRGDCAERVDATFNKLFGGAAGVLRGGRSEEVLSPETRRLLSGLRSPDPETRDKAVREINRLMAEDPLPRCQFVSPSPWGPTQCVLEDGHDERHAYSPRESNG